MLLIRHVSDITLKTIFLFMSLLSIDVIGNLILPFREITELGSLGSAREILRADIEVSWSINFL